MSDFLERNGLQTVAQHFKDLFLASVHRDGAEELLERLENETDFFEAPAGAKHHGAFPGGLVIHSLNVYRRLREITIRDLTPRDALGPAPISEQEEETVAILGLLHDVCKAGVYHRKKTPQEPGNGCVGGLPGLYVPGSPPPGARRKEPVPDRPVYPAGGLRSPGNPLAHGSL